MLIWKNKKLKQIQNQEETAVSIDAADTKKEHLGLLKHNQKCIVDKISRKVEDTIFATENLIGTINNMSKHVEIQMDSSSKRKHTWNEFKPPWQDKV
ncbi:hypothetical protein [Fonticella tunisiensis]|uniref:Uncharacterized protein n=1 Tax=Fonticella tunisiensis TaxID=1096341 RepID=A0A4R7KP75_9CLOT|nr:hypothetical protein [Fonticella tunisiensis]TDT60920.1 hypothetical protein EDD71_11037 [Fonticella tunisiensis]